MVGLLVPWIQLLDSAGSGIYQLRRGLLRPNMHLMHCMAAAEDCGVQAMRTWWACWCPGFSCWTALA